MRRAVAFVRWSRVAGWEDTLHVLLYPIRTWRCRLFGHKWGPEESEYEPNTCARVSSWRDCQRHGCEGWWETYNVYARAKAARLVGAGE